MNFSFILPLVVTTAIGIISFFIKSTLSRMESNFEKLSKKIQEIDQRHNHDIDRLNCELNQLKSDLPLVYVLREDFLRAMNNIEMKLDKILLDGRRTN